MDSFIELAKKRYSCRSYQNQPLPKEVLERILEAARIAPSAVNYQPWHFVVVTDMDLLRKVRSCYTRDWLNSAPAIIVACGDHSKSWRRSDGKDHCDIDIAIAVDHITLAAADMGLATCWVCKFDAMACSSLLGLPANITPVVLIPVGYPADISDPNRHSDKRKKLDDIVHWNGFKL